MKKMKPTGIIIHCAATPDDNNSPIDISDIRQWHLDRGFDDVGYHYVITRKGVLQKGRPDDMTGAHCKGRNDTIGICLIGTKRFNMRQFQALTSLLQVLRCQHDFRESDVVIGHNELSNKECPGFMVSILRSIFDSFDWSN